MTADVLNSLVVGFVACVLVQAVSTYAMARLFITGRGMFERRQDDEGQSRVKTVGWERTK